MKFGPVHFSEAQFRPEFLERYIPWEPGEYYSPDQLLAFQQESLGWMLDRERGASCAGITP